jgi:hypothetical protein
VTDNNNSLPSPEEQIRRDEYWKSLPPEFKQVRSVSFKLGTLDQIIGLEAAEEFFNRPNPCDQGRQVAAIKHSRYYLSSLDESMPEQA